MSLLDTKTPVSLLQEYVVSRKMVAQYELIHNGVGTHKPVFTFRVQVGTLWEEGTGRSKKDAKHRAAENMLKRLKIVESIPEESETKEESSKEAGEELMDENYVGLLKDFCAIHLYPEAKYYLEEAAGPAHSRVFKMICCVSQLKDFGISKTKKQAKQQSAFKMITRLEELVQKNKKCSISNVSDPEPPSPKNLLKIPPITLTDEEKLAKYNAIKNSTTASTKEPAVLYKDHYRAYEDLSELSPTLASILLENKLVNEVEAVELIKDIASELEVNLSSLDLPAKDSQTFQIITMSVTPPIAGVGKDSFEAAHNLLNSLLMFCRD